MSDTPKYALNVAVAGERNISLLTAGGNLAAPWARSRGYGIELVPECGEPVRQDCEFVSRAHAVVVIGDPTPWRRLLALCREAKIPVRICRTRPRLPPPRSADPLDW